MRHVGNCKFEGFASLRPALPAGRSATNSYSILGVKTKSRFRKIWFERYHKNTPRLLCSSCMLGQINTISSGKITVYVLFRV